MTRSNAAGPRVEWGFRLGLVLVVVGVLSLGSGLLTARKTMERESVVSGLREWALHTLIVTDRYSLLSPDAVDQLRGLSSKLASLRDRSAVIPAWAGGDAMPPAEFSRLLGWVGSMQTNVSIQADVTAVLREVASSLPAVGPTAGDAATARQLLAVNDPAIGHVYRVRVFLQGIKDRPRLPLGDGKAGTPAGERERLEKVIAALDRWAEDARNLRDTADRLKDEALAPAGFDRRSEIGVLGLVGAVFAAVGLVAVGMAPRAVAVGVGELTTAASAPPVQAVADTAEPSMAPTRAAAALIPPEVIEQLGALRDRLLSVCDRAVQWLSTAEAASPVDADAIIDEIAARTRDLNRVRESLLNVQLGADQTVDDPLRGALGDELEQRLQACLAGLSDLRRVVDGGEAADGEPVACIPEHDIESLRDEIMLVAESLSRIGEPSGSSRALAVLA